MEVPGTRNRAMEYTGIRQNRTVGDYKEDENTNDKKKRRTVVYRDPMFQIMRFVCSVIRAIDIEQTRTVHQITS